MARPLRIEYPGAWYHVMNRGRRREKIFYSDVDYRSFLDVLKMTCELFQVEIHAYSLMPNHYHILLHTPLGNLSRTMRHINGVYTQKFNKRNRIDGSLFRGRFKSILVEEESYLLELMRYIHRNSLKAKLEEKLGEYEWSSYRGYMKDKHKEEWLHTKRILRKFSKYEKESKVRLESFINQEVPKDINKRLEGVNWPSILGGEKFKKKIKKIIQGKEIQVNEIPGYGREFIDNSKIEEKVTILVNKYGEILGDKGVRKTGYLRRALIYVMRKELPMTLSRIAEISGGVKYSAISNQYKKAVGEISEKRGCFLQVKEVLNALNVK